MIRPFAIFHFLLLTLLNTTHVIAQKDGDYYVSVNLDTIYGEVTLSTNYSKKIIFKPISDNGEISLDASEAIEFSDNSHIYHSLKLDDFPSKEFRELLVDGQVKLYERRRATNYVSFIISKDQKLSLLEQITRIEDSKYVNETSYLRILKLILIDQPEIVKRVDKTKFSREELSALIQDYNESHNEPSIDYSKNRRKLDMFTAFEVSVHSKGFDNDGSNVKVTNALSDLNLSLGYLVGIQNFKGQELSVGIELSRVSGVLSRGYSLGMESRIFNNLLLNIPIRLNFKFGNKKFKPMIFGELVFAKIISKKYDYDLFNLNGDLLVSEKGLILSSRTIGFKLGVGATINSSFYTSLKYGSLRFDYLPNESIENLLHNPIVLTFGLKI